MIVQTTKANQVKNTTHKVVIPFYVYAGISFLVATVLLFLSAHSFTGHYFQPGTLAVTHTMALGWGTMMILGASHQLVPVLIESRLYSTLLAYSSFILAAIGIPMLVVSFFSFQFDWMAITGAILINAAVMSFLINIALSMWYAPVRNVHAVFVITAILWLLVTTLIGLLLVCNFSHSILSSGSLHYLSLHAHIGIIGWFLLLVIGVGSRLIPMFLISKYHDIKSLWTIYGLINGGLIIFITFFLLNAGNSWFLVPIALIAIALILFGCFCFMAYEQRIRKQVDEQMQVSVLSIAMMGLPIVFLCILIIVVIRSGNPSAKDVLAYGFSIFFGWLTAIIFGMTFKTLPFIVWNKVYHDKAGLGKTPNPKELFSGRIFNSMAVSYLFGFLLFIVGILMVNYIILQVTTFLLIITACLYNWNIIKMLMHKPMVK